MSASIGQERDRFSNAWFSPGPAIRTWISLAKSDLRDASDNLPLTGTRVWRAGDRTAHDPPVAGRIRSRPDNTAGTARYFGPLRPRRPGALIQGESRGSGAVRSFRNDPAATPGASKDYARRFKRLTRHGSPIGGLAGAYPPARFAYGRQRRSRHSQFGALTLRSSSVDVRILAGPQDMREQGSFHTDRSVGWSLSQCECSLYGVRSVEERVGSPDPWWPGGSDWPARPITPACSG